jgi:hypothetical protein
MYWSAQSRNAMSTFGVAKMLDAVAVLSAAIATQAAAAALHAP